jgi:pimeloyl-ACP methyl ester carboxylesterase
MACVHEAANRHVRGMTPIMPILVVAGLAVVTALAIWQSVATARDAQRYPRRGSRVKVAGEAVNLVITGAGGPPVVFLAGLGNAALAFTWIARLVSRRTTVVQYDRAGLGWSAPLKGALDAASAADTLAGALDRVGLQGPIIVVGHSYGGVVARVFAHRHRQRVAGLVMLDSAHEDQLDRFPSPIGTIARLLMAQNWLMLVQARLGLLRLPDALHGQGHGLPADVQPVFNALLATVAHRLAAAKESHAWGRSGRQARQARDLRSIPLRVLMADQWPAAMLPAWTAMQEEIASWSDDSDFEVMRGADHVSIAMSEPLAASVAGTIIALVDRVGGSKTIEPALGARA